jgi:hypothetical protein
LVHGQHEAVPGLAALRCIRAAIPAKVPNSSMTSSRFGNAPGQAARSPTAMSTPSMDKKNSSSAHIIDPGQEGYHDTRTQASTTDPAPCGI